MTFWLGVYIGVGVVAGGLALYGLHRLCIYLEDQGFMYYRKPSESGGGAAPVLMELDRLTRPSVEHVVEAQDAVQKQEKPGVGGD